MIRLFIENKEVELDKSVTFAITKQFEDLSNPTTIINDWSKTVSIPFTQKNNELFGNIFNADRVIVEPNTPVDLFSNFSLVSSSRCEYDSVTHTMTSTRAGNTNPNSNFLIIRTSNNSTNVQELMRTYKIGKDYVTTTKFPTYNELKFTFNGNNQDAIAVFKLSGITNYEQFTITWNVTILDKTDTGNNAQISNIVVTKGTTPVYWNDLHNFNYTGLYFNPLRKLNFRLEFDNSVLMQGYAKLNEVKQVNGKGTYNVTLFGQLGKVFQEMQKITFDVSTNDTEYLINGADYVDEYITNSLVNKSWTSAGQTHDILYTKYITLPNGSKIPHPAYKVTDIIGFAPNNSYSEGFDYKTVQLNTNSTKTFEDILGTGFTNATGVEPSTAIPNGLLPREIGEYRSYLQLPFVYWNKIFQMFQKKAESVTGYIFDLDTNWFNTGNTYWYDMVYMLKSFDAKSEEKVTDRVKVTTSQINWLGATVSNWTDLKSTTIYFSSESVLVKPIINFEDDTIILSDEYTVLINTNFQLNLYLGSLTNIRINPANAIQYYIDAVDTNDNVLERINGLIVDSGYTGDTSQFELVSRFAQSNYQMVDYPKLCVSLDKGKYSTDNVRLIFRAKWMNATEPFLYNGTPYRPSTYTVGLRFNNINDNTPLNFEVISNRKRSYSRFTFNDLWNNDYNLFAEIIKYCKMFRIAISVDDIGRKISFKPYKKYFSGYTVTDWTDKVDKSKDYTIKPVTFENKYILYNYKDSDTKLAKDYKEKTGVKYGEYRLITDYNFNNQTTELFTNVQQSITNTDNVLSWNNLYARKIIYGFPTEINVYNKNKEGKQVDIFGAFYLHCGLSNFNADPSLNMRSVKISDDTTFQQGNSIFCYNQTATGTTGVTTYPHLDIIKNGKLCLFNTPLENYTYLNNYTGTTIYSNIWENYINERYNIQNKMITCYVYLKPLDYINFDWYKFVKIGNQLCIVNKIYDYDITANVPTKADLITIQDVSGYTN